MPLRLSLVLLLLCAAGAQRVAAEVELTGSWTIEGDFEPFVAAVVQTGPSLTVEAFTGTPGIGYSGTIDRATGAFALEGPRQPGGFLMPGWPYGASPAPTMTGSADAAGAAFDATFVLWFVMVTPPVDVVHYPWASATFPAHGRRRDLTKCGDGQVDPDEFCDAGIANGGRCCSAVCSVIDSDQDDVCDGVDDCPTIYDVEQRCAQPLALLSARATTGGRLYARGTIPAGPASFSEVLLSVGSAHAATTVQCAGGTLHQRCVSADRAVRLRGWRRTPAHDWAFRLTATALPMSVARGPIDVGIVDSGKVHMNRGMLANCVEQATRLTCQP